MTEGECHLSWSPGYVGSCLRRNDELGAVMMELGVDILMHHVHFTQL